MCRKIKAVWLQANSCETFIVGENKSPVVPVELIWSVSW